MAETKSLFDMKIEGRRLGDWTIPQLEALAKAGEVMDEMLALGKRRGLKPDDPVVEAGPEMWALFAKLNEYRAEAGLPPKRP